MKLYYDVSACSLSPHIVLREAGLEFDLEWVDLKNLKTASGGDFNLINPKGYVPVLELDDGQFLTEGAPLVQYIADLVPETNLIPSIGSIERYRVSEWLAFTSAELHRGFTPLFSADLPADVLDAARRRLFERFDYLANHLVDNMFLMDNTFTVADAYCFTILNWAQFVDVEMSPWPALESYVERVKARPKVQEAMRAEELDFQGKA
ncbi:MAG: glutathione transferase GstA [Rhodospirillales bacterium]|jgi:glutathione S-transferase|nr:glutathione transferase GstA [Rhodospirillaceae bacterium]MDP6428664.1 glutathione transferase GstA [Rhodospirillales bacterium]MDP6644459.1 glutathione transferase GstA [Rhodospirillales bacterium]MDP6842208.1 glutathione transferase GstA [Rhodospirillales bacterium]|tara:strand:+ start:1129 stop:1749 length:621 start_codon:yes stop_codon:yes gene_type:complete